MLKKPFARSDSARGRNTRHLEAEAFFHGAHDVGLQPGLDEIQSKFERNAATLNHDAVIRQKQLEAQLDHASSRLPGAQATLGEVRARLGDRIPPVVLPLLMAVSSLIIAFAEVILMAPALDALSITNPVAQLFSALGIVLIGGLAFHMAWESLATDKFSHAWRFLIRAIAVLVGLALACWGVLRGLQVANAARLNGNPLGDFLFGHFFLAAVLYVFITLAAPLMIAAATHYSLHHLREWQEWKSAHASFNRLTKERVTAQRALEAEKAQLQHALKQNTHECAEWKSLYKLQHDRGAKHGAAQEPSWMVPKKATLAALVTAVLLCWAPALVIVPAAAAAWISAFLFYRKRWISPTPDEFYELERVQFAEPAAGRPLIQAQISRTPPTSGRKELPR